MLPPVALVNERANCISFQLSAAVANALVRLAPSTCDGVEAKVVYGPVVHFWVVFPPLLKLVAVP